MKKNKFVLIALFLIPMESTNLNIQLSKKAEDIEAERVATIRSNHNLLCQMYKFDVVCDEAGSTLGFVDVDRVHLHQFGPETSHADICLRNYLRHPELYNGTPVRGCKCKSVLKFVKKQKQMVLSDVLPELHSLRLRKLNLFDVGYKNYKKALELRL